MPAAYVNSTGKQQFDGVSTTTISTDAYSLTAGDLSVIVLRTGSGIPDGSAAVSDLAGNTYHYDGSASGGTLHVWSAPNCLGHANNVVTATYPSRQFVAVTAIQFSGAPTTITCDFTSAYVASGASVSCLPSSADANQIVVISSDLGNSGLPTFAPAATFTTIYSSGPTGNGPYILTGAGSHSVAYNLNTTQHFDGTIAVSGTYTNTTNPKSIFVAIFRQTVTPTEPTFTDGTVSHPLTKISLHLDSGIENHAEVTLNDAAGYQDGYSDARVMQWSSVTRGLSDKAGQLEHLAFGATLSDTDRHFRGLLDDEDFRYLPNRPAVLWQIDDDDRRLELPWRLTANGFISSYSPDPNLKFSVSCVDWLRKKYTRQRKSQIAWQSLVKTEDFDINVTPPQVLNKPAPFPYNPDRDDDLQTVADSVRTTGYLPDPTVGAPTLTGTPANPITKRFYFTAMNGFYGDPALQRISDHRGETYYDSVDQSVPDDQELRDQVNSGTASTYCDFPITADTATSEVRVYAGDTNGANIKYLGLATNLGGGSFNYTYGKSPLSGGPLYTPGDDAKPPARNNTYLPGTLTAGNVTTDTGSGMFKLIYTGLSAGLTDNIVRCQFLVAGCAVKGNFVVYVGGVRVPTSELDTYFVVPGRSTWTAAYDSRQYLERFGRRYTTIDVDSVYATTNGLVAADRLAAGDTPLTVNFDGIEDVGDTTGTEITNLFLQALHFAENAGPPDRPINTQNWVGVSPLEFTHISGLTYVDRASFQALAAAYPEFDGTGVGGVIGAGQEEVGFADVMARFCLSGDFQVGFNRKGQLIASREPDDVPAAVLAIDDVINISDQSFRISDGVLSDFFNVLPFRYGRDLSGRTSGGRIFDVTRGVSLNLPESDGWQSTANGDTEVEDTASQFHFDQVISAQQMDLHFLTDRTLALQVLNRVLRRYSFPLRKVTLTIPLSGTTIDLGDVFEVTHLEGIGSSGYNHEPFRCLRHELDCNQNAVTVEAYAISTIANRVIADSTFEPVTTEDGADFVVVG